MYYVGQRVRLHTTEECEWNRLFGLVMSVEKDKISVFCVNKPSWLYHVNREDAERIIEIDN
jgi:hypothetical protein